MLSGSERREAEKYLQDLALMEFPQCGMQHEDLMRNETGLPILDDRGMCQYLPQCPNSIIERRPACAHFSDMGGVIAGALLLIRSKGMETVFADIQPRYRNLHKDIGAMDQKMRDIRCGDSLYAHSYHPNADQARIAAKDLVETHTTYVQGMQGIVSEIKDALKTLLESPSPLS